MTDKRRRSRSYGASNYHPPPHGCYFLIHHVMVKVRGAAGRQMNRVKSRPRPEVLWPAGASRHSAMELSVSKVKSVICGLPVPASAPCKPNYSSPRRLQTHILARQQRHVCAAVAPPLPRLLLHAHPRPPLPPPQLTKTYVLGKTHIPVHRQWQEAC